MIGYWFSENIENPYQRWYLVYLSGIIITITIFYIVTEITFTSREALKLFLAGLIISVLLTPYAVFLEEKVKKDFEWVKYQHEFKDEGFDLIYWMKLWKWVYP